MRWNDVPIEGRLCAHPLALILEALDGETDPIQLGIAPTDPAYAAIQQAASDEGRER